LLIVAIAQLLVGRPEAPPQHQQRWKQLLYNAIYTGTTKFNIYIDSFKRALRAEFYAHIMSQVGEKLWIEYIDKRFAYTL
jgi:hypothetical protein